LAGRSADLCYGKLWAEWWGFAALYESSPKYSPNLAVTCYAEVLWLENVCGTCIFVSNFLNLFGILWVKNFKLDPTLYVVY